MDYRQHVPISAEERMQLMLEGHQATIWTALPGIVQSFNRNAMTVTVQPAIQGVVRDKNGLYSNATIPVLPDVPVCFPRGGGYTMTFPIVAGDECLIVFASRCIDGWWQTGAVSPQRELRLHDLSDGFAVMGTFSQKTVPALVSTVSTQIRSDDGQTLLDLNNAAGSISLLCNKLVTVQAPLTHVTGNATIDGNLDVAGDITSNNKVVSLTHHRHSSSGGTGTGGPPVGGS